MAAVVGAAEGGGGEVFRWGEELVGEEPFLGGGRAGGAIGDNAGGVTLSVDELGGTDEFSTEELEERLSKAQVIFYEGESSFNPSKSKASKKSVRQSSTSYSSDSE